MKLIKQFFIVKTALLAAILLSLSFTNIYNQFSTSNNLESDDVLAMATSPVKELWKDLTNQ